VTSRSKALLLAAVAFGAAAFARAPLHQPVLTENFPDPHIIKVGDRYIAYSTTTARKNVPVALSRDLVQWRRLTDPKNKGQLYDAMPTLPAWAGTGFTWAPEVLPIEGGYRLYFSAPHKKRDVQCVGVATSSDPLGPFRPHGAEPIVCQPELGGTIDAHPFRDTDGKLYLYYKNDGNNPRFLKPSQIWVQRMAADGLSVSGPAVPLVKNDTHWEWRVVEAPGNGAARARLHLVLRGQPFRLGGGPAPVQLRHRLCQLRRADGSVPGCRYQAVAGQLQRSHPRVPERPGACRRPRGGRQALPRLPRLGGDGRMPQGGQ
jgi:hypothetical protein